MMNESHDTATDPEVMETEWGFDQVDNLFEDLHNGAEVQHVQVRTASGVAPRDRVVTLSRAHQLLQQRDAKAIQIRYLFGDAEWCDTLMVGPTTVFIIRTRLS